MFTNTKKDNHFKKAEHPAYLLRNSLVSASLVAAILNAKYVKALPKERQKGTFAYLALKQIQATYREENKLRDIHTEERQMHRQLTVKPLVDVYFLWVRQNVNRVTVKSKTYNGFMYSLNQEKYLRTFLSDGEVPMDNNAAEQSIRGFCIGKKNRVMIDTVAGAQSSAIIYTFILVRNNIFIQT